MSLGSNGVDRMLLLPKILMRLRGTNFCINCTSSAYFAPSSCSNEAIQNAPKHYKTHQFMSLESNGVDRVRSLRKTLMPFRGMNFFINCTSSTILHRVPCSNETLPNAPKHYEMLQNMSLDPMGWIEYVLCEKFRCDFMAQTCALIASVQPVLHRVSCSNERLTNAPKHYENAPKHEFRIQWGGSSAFVARNSYASSWLELLH